MSCRSCNSYPCNCSGQIPYYEDPCFQENQNQGCKIYNQYSAVIRISTGWAVPEGSNILTLKVAALADILIGADIWNPDYGAYNIVSYDPEGQLIKVVKSVSNDTAVGTVIPACTKFIVTNPSITSLGSFINFTPNPLGASGGGGDLSSVSIDYAKWAEVGERIDISISFDFDIVDNTIGWINITLPKVAASDANQSAECRLKVGSSVDVGIATIIAGQARAVIRKRDESVMAISSGGECSCNFFYRKEL